MLKIYKTLIFSFFLSALGAFAGLYIQLRPQKILPPCSYLDPIVVDIAAFIGGAFLAIESLVGILKHRESLLSQQMTRCFRMAFGYAIIATHVVQFLHK